MGGTGARCFLPPSLAEWRGGVGGQTPPAAPWVHRHSRSPIPASGAPSPVRATAEAVGGGTLVRLDRSPAADEEIQTLSGSSHGMRNEGYLRLKWLSDILRCCFAFPN